VLAGLLSLWLQCRPGSSLTGGPGRWLVVLWEVVHGKLRGAAQGDHLGGAAQDDHLGGASQGDHLVVAVVVVMVAVAVAVAVVGLPPVRFGMRAQLVLRPSLRLAHGKLPSAAGDHAVVLVAAGVAMVVVVSRVEVAGGMPPATFGLGARLVIRPSLLLSPVGLVEVVELGAVVQEEEVGELRRCRLCSSLTGWSGHSDQGVHRTHRQSRLRHSLGNVVKWKLEWGKLQGNSMLSELLLLRCPPRHSATDR